MQKKFQEIMEKSGDLGAWFVTLVFDFLDSLGLNDDSAIIRWLVIMVHDPKIFTALCREMIQDHGIRNLATKLFAENRRISLADLRWLIDMGTYQNATGYQEVMEALKKSAGKAMIITSQSTYADLVNMAQLLWLENPEDRSRREEDIFQAILLFIECSSDRAANFSLILGGVDARRRFIQRWIERYGVLKAKSAETLAIVVRGDGDEEIMRLIVESARRWGVRFDLEAFRNRPPIDQVLAEYLGKIEEAFVQNPILLKPGFESAANAVVGAIATGKL